MQNRVSACQEITYFLLLFLLAFHPPLVDGVDNTIGHWDDIEHFHLFNAPSVNVPGLHCTLQVARWAKIQRGKRTSVHVVTFFGLNVRVYVLPKVRTTVKVKINAPFQNNFSWGMHRTDFVGAGGAFIQITAKYTICMITCFGSVCTLICPNSATDHRVLSLIVRTFRSASVTCSFVAHVLTIAMLILSTILSDSWSISIRFTINSPLAYSNNFLKTIS